MKALHVTEVRDLVSLHLLRLPQRFQDMLRFQHSKSCIDDVFNLNDSFIKVAIPRTTPSIAEHELFELKPDFRQILSQLPYFDQDKYRFSYGEITRMLSDYILSRKATFFDSRNIKLAFVANDPLGKVFQVDSFHRCQVTTLLRKQLIPVD